MTDIYLRNDYFEWLRSIINDANNSAYIYSKLLRKLNDIDFRYSIDMDGNREIDGIDLRYRFGCDENIPQPVIASVLDTVPCSVFEMMCALSLRCEESIMNEPNKNNGASEIFWIMIQNLGLGTMNDILYDERVVVSTIHRFLDREYEFDGHGGLFVIKDTDVDLRGVEIWHQMCWYLDRYLNI